MTAPDTPPPPSGPGRTEPLAPWQRRGNYQQQNNAEHLTPRQRRRYDHKYSRAQARAGRRSA